MTNRSDNTLRREFIGLGLTGAMVGLAGCSDINIETEGGEDPTDEGSGGSGGGNVNLDTASFSFSYDDNIQQVSIEFTGGADIAAGDLQIRQDGGKRVQWAELGSTTTGPDEIIESGSTATLGSNILNWETQISAEDTIRLVYTGKETPATLERYSPPEDTDTDTTVPASISEFTLESQSEQRLRISFIADKQLETLELSISGTESRTLQLADFTESQTGSGSYLYEAAVSVGSEGSYTATLEQAVDTNGNDSTTGQSLSATTDFTTETEDTTPPTIDAFSVANPSSQQLRVSFDSSERLTSIQVNITGTESISLTETNFSGAEASSGRYTYEATTETNATGSFTATLTQAADANRNDGANNQSVSVTIEEPTDQSGSSGEAVSFEQAAVGANKPTDPWSIVNDPTANSFTSVEISGDHATDGSQSLHMTGNGDLDRILVGVNADLSDVAAVQCDVYIEQANVSVGEIWFGRWLDGESDKRIGFMGQTGEGENRFNLTGEFTGLEGDMSDLTGEHELVFNMRGDNEAYFDNLRFLDDNNRVISPSDVLIEDSPDQLSYTFENGPEGWTFGKRGDERSSEGTGSWSEQHDGSLRLHVDGAPEAIMAWKEVGPLSAGTTITANYTPSRFEYAAATLRLSAVVPGEGTVVSDRDSDNGENPEQDGNLQIEIPRDLPAETQLEFELVIWPGETTVYIQDVQAGSAVR